MSMPNEPAGGAADRATSSPPPDLATAEAFARSWNSVGSGSVYSREQFLEWFAPLDVASFRGLEVLELGFGNGSLLVHMADAAPARLVGIELGDTLATTRRNLGDRLPGRVELLRGDLTAVDLGPRFDLVYSIGVLHHLDAPGEGFRALLRHTRPGGRFHGWVYAREGNAIVRLLVEPLRRLGCRLPWWFTKWGLALPLVVPFFLYAKGLAALERTGPLPEGIRRFLPLPDYGRWIATREFRFFHHVAFDQIVTPRTRYLPREVVEGWLASPEVAPGSGYLRFRNGNGWVFGGTKAR